MSIGVLEIAVKFKMQSREIAGEHIRTLVGEVLRDFNEKFGELIKTDLKSRDLRDIRIAQTLAIGVKTYRVVPERSEGKKMRPVLLCRQLYFRVWSPLS